MHTPNRSGTLAAAQPAQPSGNSRCVASRTRALSHCSATGSLQEEGSTWVEAVILGRFATDLFGPDWLRRVSIGVRPTVSLEHDLPPVRLTSRIADVGDQVAQRLGRTEVE